MKKGDCILCSDNTDKTLYFVTEDRGDKLDAVCIYISPIQIQSLPFEREYNNVLPDGSILLPSSVYSTIKQLIKNCLEEIYDILQSEAIDEDFEIKVDSKYTDGQDIYTMKHFSGNRWYYRLFKVEEENLSPYWTGDASADSLRDTILPITEDTYQKVLQCYNSMQVQIAKHLEDRK